MSTKEATLLKYKLVKRIKDEKFDIDQIEYYSLSLQIGVYDFQICVIDSKSNRCVGIEDYRLKAKTSNERILIIRDILKQHEYVSAGFWKDIKVFIKTHKFTLVPSTLFVSGAEADYLCVNSHIKTDHEEVTYYKQIGTDSVITFAYEKRLVNWIQNVYKNKTVHIIHQASAIIEGSLKNDSIESKESVHTFIDRGIIHIVAIKHSKLLYYNQFPISKKEDFAKFLALVLKELKLDREQTPVILSGFVNPKSESVQLLKKYIKNISYSSRPSFLKFNYQFDEIQDYEYLDILSGYLCD